MTVNLVLLKKDGSKKVFLLQDGLTVIGRGRECNLRIPLESVSKKHCQLSLDGNTLKINDIGSRNGTFLNGRSIIEETDVNAGDKIRIGPLKFLLKIDGNPEDTANIDTTPIASVENTSAVGSSESDEFATQPEVDAAAET
jgi:pSer/pThr/pTyr-binding forkhead associated (FHA) protein